MSRSRLPLVLGLTAAGGIGYYLYSAGGDPKVAQKQAEADANRFKSELPGRGDEIRRDAEKYGAQAGARVDDALSKAQAELRKATADAEAHARDAKAAALKKVDEFDKKIEDEASKARGGISSWFGGGGK